MEWNVKKTLRAIPETDANPQSDELADVGPGVVMNYAAD